MFASSLIVARIAATDLNVTTVDTPAVEAVPKRRRLEVTVVPIVTVATAVPTGPVQRKCQGCTYGNLLELKILKLAEFLEKAICDDECKEAPVTQTGLCRFIL